MPIEMTRLSSNTGRQVTPLFVVFQMPPPAAATKSVLRRAGNADDVGHAAHRSSPARCCASGGRRRWRSRAFARGPATLGQNDCGASKGQTSGCVGMAFVETMGEPCGEGMEDYDAGGPSVDPSGRWSDRVAVDCRSDGQEDDPEPLARVGPPLRSTTNPAEAMRSRTRSVVLVRRLGPDRLALHERERVPATRTVWSRSDSRCISMRLASSLKNARGGRPRDRSRRRARD